jgi:hypothetical protein
MQSLLGAAERALYRVVKSRLTPGLRRLLPGRRGRPLIAGIVLIVSLVAQAFMLILLAQLVDLCISLFEVWALLARKYVELS